MQEFPPKVMSRIAEHLSLQNLRHSRGASRFFAQNLFVPYLRRILQYIDQKSVKQTAQGNGFELVLLEDGTVYSRGKNEFGALGHGDVQEVNDFSQIKGLPRIVQILANCDSAYYLSMEGEVYFTGQDRLHLITGQAKVALQDGSKKIYCRTPYKVPKLSEITKMSISTKTCFFVTKSGKVFGCGTNDYGQVLPVPGCRGVMQELVEISGVNNAKNVVASSFHTIIQCDEFFYSFGENGSGQLCLGHCRGKPGAHTFRLNFQPIEIYLTNEATFFLTPCDQLYIFGKAVENGSDEAIIYKERKCIGTATDLPKFQAPLNTPKIDIPHEPLITEIRELCTKSIAASEQLKTLPPALIEKLNTFSKLLCTIKPETIKLSYQIDDRVLSV